jgi:hypothetical protein
MTCVQLFTSYGILVIYSKQHIIYWLSIVFEKYIISSIKQHHHRLYNIAIYIGHIIKHKANIVETWCPENCMCISFMPMCVGLPTCKWDWYLVL